METILLNNGMELTGHCIHDGDRLYIYLDHYPMADGFVLLNNPDNTSQIVFRSYGKETVYIGYTKLSSINEDFGNCNAVMRKVYSDEQNT